MEDILYYIAFFVLFYVIRQVKLGNINLSFAQPTQPTKSSPSADAMRRTFVRCGVERKKVLALPPSDPDYAAKHQFIIKLYQGFLIDFKDIHASDRSEAHDAIAYSAQLLEQWELAYTAAVQSISYCTSPPLCTARCQSLLQLTLSRAKQASPSQGLWIERLNTTLLLFFEKGTLDNASDSLMLEAGALLFDLQRIDEMNDLFERLIERRPNTPTAERAMEYTLKALA